MSVSTKIVGCTRAALKSDEQLKAEVAEWEATGWKFRRLLKDTRQIELERPERTRTKPAPARTTKTTTRGGG